MWKITLFPSRKQRYASHAAFDDEVHHVRRIDSRTLARDRRRGFSQTAMMYEIEQKDDSLCRTFTSASDSGEVADSRFFKIRKRSPTVKRTKIETRRDKHCGEHSMSPLRSG